MMCEVGIAFTGICLCVCAHTHRHIQLDTDASICVYLFFVCLRVSRFTQKLEKTEKLLIRN